MNYRLPFQGSYPVTQEYGEVIPGITYKDKPHTGVDYGCPESTPIVASADGKVIFSGFDNTGYGGMIIIQHKDGNATLYAHLLERVVYAGETVKQGDCIGLSGQTGYATGPHLHFEARKVWSDPKTHFDPAELNLINSVDQQKKFLEPEDLGEKVKVIAPLGAKVYKEDWTMDSYKHHFPSGTKLRFTGKTLKRPGYPQYTYCEVYEEPQSYYVAIHNEDTQILGNREE